MDLPVVEILGKHDLDKGVPPVGGSGALLVFFPLKNKERTILSLTVLSHTT